MCWWPGQSGKSVITYSDLAKEIELGHYRLSRQLDPIYYYCKRNKLPPLSIIVVEKDTGRPSQGSFDEYSPSQRRRSWRR